MEPLNYLEINIPEWKVNDFFKLMRSLKRKGFTVDYTDNGEEYIKINGGIYLCRNIAINTNYSYAVDNWEFIGVVRFLDSGNVIEVYNDIDVPDYYRTCKCECDHCHTVRDRNYTYLVRNRQTGEIKQIGKTCLKSYTGLSPAVCAEALSLESYLSSLTDCTINLPKDTSYYKRYETDRVIKLAYEEIINHGFTSTSEGDKSTKIKVFNNYQGTHDPKENSTARDQMDQWILNLECKSDFEFNAKNIYKSKYCAINDIGYICAIINNYLRYVDKCRREEIAALRSKTLGYAGEIGYYIRFTVHDARVIFSKRYCYGADVTNTYRIVDDEGHVILWSTTKELIPGESYEGMVKGHKEFRGELQTVVTRCKLIQ